MSSTTTPIAAAFEMQRRSIEFGERLFEQGLAAQRDATESAMRNGFAAQREAQQQGLELARRLFHAQADAVQTTLNGDEFRSIVDRQFEALDEDQAIAMDEFEATLLDAFEELSERQRTVFVETIESALDAHADVERQAVEGVGRTEEVAQTAQQGARTVAEASQQGTEQMAAQTTRAVEQGVDASQAAGTAVQQGTAAARQSSGTSQQGTAAAQQGAAAAREGADAAQQGAAAVQQGSQGQQAGGAQQPRGEAPPQTAGRPPEGAAPETGQQPAEQQGGQSEQEPPLEAVDGLGPTYAERLETEGIQAMPDLAAADPGLVAETADVAEDQAEEWIETAQSMD